MPNTIEKRSSVATMQTFCKAIDLFRMIHDEFPPQLMQLLLTVAMNPNATMTTIGEKSNLTLSQVSRHVERLGHRWGREAGHDLVETVENPDDRRQKLVKLTHKGEKFVQTLIGLINA